MSQILLNILQCTIQSWPHKKVLSPTTYTEDIPVFYLATLYLCPLCLESCGLVSFSLALPYLLLQDHEDLPLIRVAWVGVCQILGHWVFQSGSKRETRNKVEFYSKGIGYTDDVRGLKKQSGKLWWNSQMGKCMFIPIPRLEGQRRR